MTWGIPQALGRPGWVAGGAGTELGGTSGFAHPRKGTGEAEQAEGALPGCVPQGKVTQRFLVLCPHGKGT